MQRKTEHVEICASQDVQARSGNGLQNINLPVSTIPTIAFSQIDLSTKIFEKSFSIPIYIPGMTGGMEEGARINQNLAAAASAFNIPMGVGSQRVMAAAAGHTEKASIRETFELKRQYPDLFLIGNIGMGQLAAPSGVNDALRCAESIDANAMAVHCNSLQEIVQKEGDRDFRQFLANLAELKANLSIPLLIKEVGTGMDSGSLQKLRAVGLQPSDCIDIGGHGGTNWAWIEGIRGDERSRRLAGILREVGVSTADSIQNFSHVFTDSATKPGLIATGGMRSGLDIAKAICLGAKSCGVGLPLFKSALESKEKVLQELEMLTEEIRASFFACGAENLQALQDKYNRDPRGKNGGVG